MIVVLFTRRKRDVQNNIIRRDTVLSECVQVTFEACEKSERYFSVKLFHKSGGIEYIGYIEKDYVDRLKSRLQSEDKHNIFMDFSFTWDTPPKNIRHNLILLLS